MISYKQTLKTNRMEESKMKPESGKKLTYEELSKVASDLHVQYQKLMAEYKKALAALESREFDSISFLLHSLFKVLDHPELFKDEFVKWSIENIQGALTSFAENLQGAGESEKAENATETQKADEA